MTARWLPLRVLLVAIVALSSCSRGESSQTNEPRPGASPTAHGPEHHVSGPDGGPVATAARETGDRSSFYLKAADQRSDGREVVITEASFAGTMGWVAIHAFSRDGQLGPIIGVSELLPPGPSTGIRVSLSAPLKASASVFPMLHLETTNNATFDFPEGDSPAVAEGSGSPYLPIRIYVRR